MSVSYYYIMACVLHCSCTYLYYYYLFRIVHTRYSIRPYINRCNFAGVAVIIRMTTSGVQIPTSYITRYLSMLSYYIGTRSTTVEMIVGTNNNNIQYYSTVISSLWVLYIMRSSRNHIIWVIGRILNKK